MKLLTSDFFAWSHNSIGKNPPPASPVSSLLFPVLESFVTPIPSHFLSLDNSAYAHLEVLLRDGRLGLAHLFCRNKPSDIKTRFYLKPEILDVVPESWRKNISSYRMVSQSRPEDCSHGLFSISLFNFFLDRMHLERELSWIAGHYDFEKITLVVLHANFQEGLDPIMNLSSCSQLIEKYFGVLPRIVSGRELMSQLDFSGIAYRDLCLKDMVSCGYLENYVLARGAANIESPGVEKVFKGEVELPCSVHHHLEIISRPKFPKALPTEDLQEMASEWERFCGSLKAK